MYKKIKKPFNYDFRAPKDGLYSISVEASCKSGKMLGLYGGEDLRAELDDIKLREIPAKNRAQYYNIPPAWNGTQLKGKSKTVIFILKLNKGKHVLRFIPQKGTIINQEPIIKPLKSSKILEKIQSPEKNRQPWITLVLIDLPLKTLDVSVACKKRTKDSDDLGIIIDGQIQKNEQSNWWGRNWYFRGSQMQGETKVARFYPKLPKGIHYIEFWADRTPVLNSVSMDVGIKLAKPPQKKEKEIKPKTPEAIIKQVNQLYKNIRQKNPTFNKTPKPLKKFTKYDKEIKIASQEFNIDSIILKATIAQESSFGKQIEHDWRYVGESGLMGLEKKQSISTLKKLGYNFDYNKIEDVTRASAAYYNWLKERPTTFDFKDKNNPLKLYTQYRSDLKAEKIYTAGIPQFLYYYFYYK